MNYLVPESGLMGSGRQGTLLHSMSSVVGLRPTPPPLLAWSRVPYRPERLPPCLFGGSKAPAHRARGIGCPIPAS